MIGELDSAESDFKRSFELRREIENENHKMAYETVCHQELGRLLAYRGKFRESKKEIVAALKIAQKFGVKQNEGLSHVYLSICSLFMSQFDDALQSATKARELADAAGYERDLIQAEYLLGASYLMKEELMGAEQHLAEALTRDRKINLVELEPDILLAFAKLRFKQNHKEEALKFAEEALQIADRCEYRLEQADIHNFMTEFYLDAKDTGKAKAHAERAKERAECGYVPALEKAENLLKEIDERST